MGERKKGRANENNSNKEEIYSDEKNDSDVERIPDIKKMLMTLFYKLFNYIWKKKTLAMGR